MKTNLKNVAAIILAAGEATRFNRGKPAVFQKVLQKVHGRPMIDYTVDLLKKLNLGQIIVVVGHYGQDVKKHLGGQFTYAVQAKRLGTLDAAIIGVKKVKKNCNQILVVNGDDSFRYKIKTLNSILAKHFEKNVVLTFLTLERDNPAGLGRVVRDKTGKVQAVVEEKDATKAQRKISEINCGLYVFDKNWFLKNFKKVDKSQVTGELYLVDLIKIAVKQHEKIETYELLNPTEWFGINTLKDLALANQ